MSQLLLLATATMLGFLHAFEIDHMLAVTTFVSRRPRLRTAAEFGARWGLGHSIAVLAAGSLLLATGLRWPERYDQLGEAAVGLMLAGLGAWALRSARQLHLHSAAEHGGHAHLHVHGAAPTHAHPHAPDGSTDTRAGHDHGGITLVGLLHGLAGTSAVVALVPITFLHSVPLGLGYLVCFGIGVTAAMSLFAFIAAAAMRRAIESSMRWGRRVISAVGTVALVVGAGWIWRALA